MREGGRERKSVKGRLYISKIVEIKVFIHYIPPRSHRLNSKNSIPVYKSLFLIQTLV